jgi:nitroreductase / dihydropteridine reductase
MSLIETLKWRYATKRMNGTKVPQEKVDNILEAIRLTPTSYGMQAFKVIVIENPELRQRIFEEACPQPQIKEASHLLVFAANVKVTKQQADDYISFIASERGMQVEALADYRSRMDVFVNGTEERNFAWAARQTYIALGIALVAAATERVDSTPIEGFSPEALDKLLGLREQNLGSVTLLPLGYRDEATDYLAKAKKVRKSKENLFDFK